MTQSSAPEARPYFFLLLFLLLFSATSLLPALLSCFFSRLRRMNQHATADGRQCASHEAHRAKTKCLYQWN
jgi:hypothetical protein